MKDKKENENLDEYLKSNNENDEQEKDDDKYKPKPLLGFLILAVALIISTFIALAATGLLD